MKATPRKQSGSRGVSNRIARNGATYSRKRCYISPPPRP